ncbi:MAG: phasin family protein [Alphaproteobacteria bacterium]|nr:phasin family protein [Alphaproteobacteria bacterium]
MSKTSNSNPFDQLIKGSTEFSNQYSEACTKSTSILMKGLEGIVETAMSLIQSSTDKQAKFVKQAISSKNVNELTEIQSKIAQENFDDFVAGLTKISEMSVKVLSDSSEPLNSELSKVVKKATKATSAAAA